MEAKLRRATACAAMARVVTILIVAALPLVGALAPTATDPVAFAQQRGGVNPEVINGKPVPNGKYPFLVYVGKVGCTGSLIDEQWVLTAAHCVVTKGKVDPPSKFELVLFSPDKTKGERMAVTKVVSHPDYYKTGEVINDVALLRLAEPVDTENTVRYPSKGNTRFERVGQPVVMVGWGATDPKGEHYPDRAREAKANVVGFKECEKAWGELSPEIVCAFAPLRDTCFGDSGGPLLVDTPKGWVQIGAMSFGGSPCGGGDPAGYSRLSAPIIANFIAKTISEQPPAQS